EQAEHREQKFEVSHRSAPAARWQRSFKFPSKKEGGSRRPGAKSLWLLPSGPDQVGDSAVRRLPRSDMVERSFARKFASSLTVHAERRRSADDGRAADSARRAGASLVVDPDHRDGSPV